VIVSHLGELEVEARDWALKLEAAGKLSHGFVEGEYPATTSSGLVPLDPWLPIPRWASQVLEERYPNGDRLIAAFALARDVRAAEALLTGDDVPKHRLDPEWIRKARA
jgi:hypothetical protein